MGPKKKGADAEVVKTAEQIREQQVAARMDLRFRLEAETKNSKINTMKIQNQWRKIMRLAKTESLKKDIEILSQNHERDVDRKDAILQMLDRYTYMAFSTLFSEVVLIVTFFALSVFPFCNKGSGGSRRPVSDGLADSFI